MAMKDLCLISDQITAGLLASGFRTRWILFDNMNLLIPMELCLYLKDEGAKGSCPQMTCH